VGCDPKAISTKGATRQLGRIRRSAEATAAKVAGREGRRVRRVIGAVTNYREGHDEKN